MVEKPQTAPADLNQMLQDPLCGQGRRQSLRLPASTASLQIPRPEQRPRSRASGSGFFAISADGFLSSPTTMWSMAAEKITVVTNDQRRLPARVVGSRPGDRPGGAEGRRRPGFNTISFEDRARPRVGDWVVAVGNPFGLGGTATAGIVSALGRQNVSGSSFVNYMQIDAPINRGNSGGPTFDVAGRVVGINTSIYTPSGGSVGIGFDIPADVAARVTNELMSGHSVTRGYIGATIQSLSPDLAASLGLRATKGALIDQLTAEGPAARAGLRSGDIVTSVDGYPVTSSAELTQQIALARPGEEIHLRVLRDGEPRDVAITSGQRPSETALAAGAQDDSGDAGQTGLLGMRVAPDANGGLVVEGLSPDSDAAQKGMQQGDVILRAGVRPIQSATDLSQAVESAKLAGRTSVPLLVARGNQRFYVAVPIGAVGSG